MKKNFCSLSHIQLAFGFTLLASGVAIGQMRVVTGTVTDNINNKPISGVSIFQEGSDTVATTNSSGIYRVQVSGENPVIVFKHPDYADRKVSLGDRVAVDVSLGEENGNGNEKAIEEVVLNAGYYKVRDKERTGSIARVSAKDIENQPVTNVLAAAQGRMAGVSITQTSGVAGGGFDIQIRGKNSIRREGNEPLYIIDGVPMNAETPSLYAVTILPSASISPLNAINPNDIESFEILKDADATAIYGSRGANGVVIVTTKKGKKGRTELKLNTSYSLSRVANSMEMMGTDEYLGMRKQAFVNDGISTYPAAAYDMTTWDQNRFTDWQKVLIGNTADASSLQLSLNGGSENTSFLISYGHQEQATVFPADFKYRTNNLTGNFTFRSPDKRLEVNMNNTFSFQENNVQNDDLTRRALQLSPNAPALYDEFGNLNWEKNTFNNPIASFKSEYLNSTTFINNGTNISYKLFPFLSLKLNGGVTYQDFEEMSLKPHTMYNPASALTSANSNASRNNQTVFSYLLEPQVTADFSFGDHRFDVLVGTTLQQSETRQGSIVGIGFESNALIRNIGAAKTKTVSDQIRNQYFYTAAFARFNYQFKKRYILNFTGRLDGSSRFSPENRFGNFGAIGAAWLFSEESFLKENSWLSFGKLRGSIGTTGNDKIGDYQYLNTYGVSPNIYNGITGLLPSRLYNRDFTWERTVKKEVAMELGFLRNRLNLSAAYYNNSSSNQLVGIPLPATTGFATIQSNLPAKVQNTGWEFELSGQVLKSGDFRFDSSFNLTVPRNKLLEFPNLEGSTYANQYMIGYPMTLVKVYQFEGVDPETGLYSFTDFNGDGKITSPDDTKVIEKMGVELFGGWSGNFRYKQWSASFLFQFVKQRSWNYNRSMLVPGSMNNQPVEVLDAWSPTNPTGTYMQYTSGANAQKNSLHSFFQNSTAAVGDASFIRLKNVQLNYSIPVQKFGIKDASIYLQGQNLLTITNYFGVDPEFTVVGYLPPLKTYSMGLQLTF
ncbi:TonB-dependent Receptor Plug Domain protein [Chryseobacterium sp. MOF25P]|uniref:SusC/RagA family TonB-linked outer membrane protein n=1 Tax=unclassified Chryseobacterium TaxID=2593645 RepID=UPI000804E09E|nr:MULTISPECIES: SusC/RagA family TonB-linked outer membrane protein [unclassified Chryseobacterium]OBW40236.1 TonB-dependent Receptor Plug Domain protein [Chryseobacterium sp. MOF25P]OBW44198.1 TonB-dependent Receptor Plug Domain protein [Chryseobacterium sp. BGARF1]